jgi:hypothetical protein
MEAVETLVAMNQTRNERIRKYLGTTVTKQ